MITWTSLSPRALKAVVEGRVTKEDVREAFQRMDALVGSAEKVDMLADVRGQVSIELSATIMPMARTRARCWSA